MTKQLIAQMVEAAEKSVADLVEKASNEAIPKKLGKLGVVCRTIVLETRKEFSVAEVARQYNDRYPKLSLSEQTIRNKRSNGNPYMAVYREWEKVTHAVAAAARTGQRRDGLILRESDLHTIKDPTLRHQVTLVFAQNRSLHNSVNMLKKRTHPTSAVVPDVWYFAKRVTLSLALRSSGDAGRGCGRVGASAAVVAG